MTGRAGIVTRMLAAFCVFGRYRSPRSKIPPRSIPAQAHIVEIVPGDFSRYKNPDGGEPQITLKAERVACALSARQAKMRQSRQRDRSAALSLLRLPRGVRHRGASWRPIVSVHTEFVALYASQ